MSFIEKLPRHLAMNYLIPFLNLKEKFFIRSLNYFFCEMIITHWTNCIKPEIINQLCSLELINDKLALQKLATLCRKRTLIYMEILGGSFAEFPMYCICQDIIEISRDGAILIVILVMLLDPKIFGLDFPTSINQINERHIEVSRNYIKSKEFQNSYLSKCHFFCTIDFSGPMLQYFINETFKKFDKEKLKEIENSNLVYSFIDNVIEFINCRTESIRLDFQEREIAEKIYIQSNKWKKIKPFIIGSFNLLMFNRIATRYETALIRKISEYQPKLIEYLSYQQSLNKFNNFKIEKINESTSVIEDEMICESSTFEEKQLTLVEQLIRHRLFYSSVCILLKNFFRNSNLITEGSDGEYINYNEDTLKSKIPYLISEFEKNEFNYISKMNMVSNILAQIENEMGKQYSKIIDSCMNMDPNEKSSYEKLENAIQLADYYTSILSFKHLLECKAIEVILIENPIVKKEDVEC